MAHRIEVSRPVFPSGEPKLDAIAGFLGTHLFDTGASLSNAYGVARVIEASQEFVDAIQDGRDYDPFKGDAGSYTVCQLRVSTERSWVDAAISKSLAEVKTALLSRRMSEGPITDDEVPEWFDSIGFDYKIVLSSVTQCSATLWVWWQNDLDQVLGQGRR